MDSVDSLDPRRGLSSRDRKQGTKRSSRCRNPSTSPEARPRALFAQNIVKGWSELAFATVCHTDPTPRRTNVSAPFLQIFFLIRVNAPFRDTLWTPSDGATVDTSGTICPLMEQQWISSWLDWTAVVTVFPGCNRPLGAPKVTLDRDYCN